MTGWLKSMIERCKKRRDLGKCATCVMARACPQASTAKRELQPAALATLFRRFADRIEERGTAPYVTRNVTNLLESRLADGADCSAEAIAHAMGMTRSTLYRRLAAEGTSVERLLEQVRRRLADFYLRRESRSVKETAYRLGFADPSAFSRAYKRWTGTSPSQVLA